MSLKSLFPKTLIDWLCLAFGVSLLPFLYYFLNYHLHLITYPYPLEFRESAMILTTHLLVQGQNPFDLAHFPQATNSYGIFYSLVVYPFAKIWGPTLQVHRLFTGIFILASCLVMVCVLRKNNAPPALSWAGGLLLYPVLLYPTTTTPVAGPHSLGLFLFLLSVYIPFFLNYSWASLLISLICGLLAFYTKMYFVLGIPIICAYLLMFRSPKKAFILGAAFLLILLVSAIAVNHYMICYFNDTFYTQFQGANSFDGGMKHSNAQMKEFYRIHHLLFYLLGISMVVCLFGWIKNYKNFSFKYKGNLNLFSLFIATLVIYFMMGRSNGQWMAYLFQLMSPFFILCVLNAASHQKFLIFLSMPFILLALMGLKHDLSNNPYTSDDNWIALRKLVAENKNILNSPLIVPFLIEYQRPVYDSGQSQFAIVGCGRQHLNTKLFPFQPEIAARFTDYAQQVHAMIREKKFDMLILTAPSFNSPLAPSDTKLYYKDIETFRVRLIHSDEVLDMVVSVPRS